MNEVLSVFLEQVGQSGLNATALRQLKKDFGNGINPLIKAAIGDPVSRKRARLEQKLADIQAQLAETTPEGDTGSE